MSLMALSQEKNREQDDMFLLQTADLAATETRPEPTGMTGRQETRSPLSQREKTPSVENGEAHVGETRGGPDPAPIADTTVNAKRVSVAPHVPVDQETPVSDPGTPEMTSLRAGPGAPVTSGPIRTRGEPVRAPRGVPEGVAAVCPTEEDRVAALTGERVRGSISDAGAIEDMLAGLPPRPSVASQREIKDFNRRRLGEVEIRRPLNWPAFMVYPTDAELRALRREGVTPGMLRDFEAQKQKQADAMEARAREINAWIFSYGDEALNGRHRIARARNRDEAIRKRSLDDQGKEEKARRPRPDEITDEELYKDSYYGIRFALLLNTDPNHLNRLHNEPVAAWGHDLIRTQDGGRIRAGEDEIRVTTVSMQAAKIMVMEARARGWETLRISGDNEFCAAVKQACKEQGIGAIITRRGPLGLGPFSRPEIIMPRLPDPLGPVQPGPQDQDRARKEAAAPSEDREVAAALLEPRPEKGPDPENGTPAKRFDAVNVRAPFEKESVQDALPENTLPS